MAAMLSYYEGLTFGSHEAIPETRKGMPLYSGTSHRFVEWRFKVNSRKRPIMSITDDELRGRELCFGALAVSHE